MREGSDYAEKMFQLQDKSYKEREHREAKGVGDKWSEMQDVNMPDIDSLFVGYKIEILFEYTDDDSSSLVNWYSGEVSEIVNEKRRIVKVKWNECCLGRNDEVETKEKLQPTKWNPKVALPGAWHQYLSGKNK
jgi:hypothetical protein